MKRIPSGLEIALTALAGIAIVVTLFGFIVVRPYFESRAYNKLTGAKTTYWDAVWLELRVEGQPK